MSQITEAERLSEKTPEASLQHILQSEFALSYREAREIVQTARETLGVESGGTTLRPGQVRLVVAAVHAPLGAPLAETARVEVTLTVDAGAEDALVQQEQGRISLRRGRILRLLEEALEQGGVLTEEDLARALQVTRRTIERDIQALRAEGHLLSTRGHVQGVGRGQTHKVKIIELWLDRQGYDQIARWVHHSPLSIKRYIQTFLRVVALQRQGYAVAEIAFLVGVTRKLVQEYLDIVAQLPEHPSRQTKLEEELPRVVGLQALTTEGGALR